MKKKKMNKEMDTKMIRGAWVLESLSGFSLNYIFFSSIVRRMPLSGVDFT